MITNQDIKYLQLCLELAQKGAGFVSPNPLVGTVIVKNNQILAQGFHQRYGDLHAERAALNKLAKKNNNHLKNCALGATAYINLEPCSHQGKQPPCTAALIEAGIKRVVFCIRDPNPLVKKNDATKLLKKQHIQVDFGALEKEANHLNRIYLKYIQKKLPYYILKTASSLDGKIATTSGESKWITNQEARNKVQKIRFGVDAILVGVNTIIKDNPSLTLRLQKNKKAIYRIILDTNGRTPKTAKIIKENKDKKTILVLNENVAKNTIASYKKLGVTILLASLDKKTKQIDLIKLSKQLYKLSICSILVEGGGTVNASFLETNLLDEYYGFIAPIFIGGKESSTSVEGQGIIKLATAQKLKEYTTENIGPDLLVHGFF